MRKSHERPAANQPTGAAADIGLRVAVNTGEVVVSDGGRAVSRRRSKLDDAI